MNFVFNVWFGCFRWIWLLHDLQNDSPASLWFILDGRVCLPLCFSADTKPTNLSASWFTCLRFIVFHDKFSYARWLKLLYEWINIVWSVCYIPPPPLLFFFSLFWTCVCREIVLISHWSTMFGVQLTYFISGCTTRLEINKRIKTYWCTQTYPCNMQNINK